MKTNGEYRFTRLRVLHIAKGYLECGWTQGVSREYKNGSDCFCVTGALNQAVEDCKLNPVVMRPIMYRDICVTIRPSLAKIADNWMGSRLVHWNEHPERTQKEVLTMVDRTIKRLEGAL